MPQLLHSEIFFFISSIGFVILFVIIAILLFYLIKAVRSFNNLIDKIDKNIDKVGDAGLDLVDEMRNSLLFRMILGRPKIRLTKK